MSAVFVTKAVDLAVQACIADGILDDFLTKHRAEVLDVCLTEFNETTYEKAIREEERKESAYTYAKNLIEIGVDINIIAKGIPDIPIDTLQQMITKGF